jgi:hypothetical protein
VAETLYLPFPNFEIEDSDVNNIKVRCPILSLASVMYHGSEKVGGRERSIRVMVRE